MRNTSSTTSNLVLVPTCLRMSALRASRSVARSVGGAGGAADGATEGSGEATGGSTLALGVGTAAGIVAMGATAAVVSDTQPTNSPKTSAIRFMVRSSCERLEV